MTVRRSAHEMCGTSGNPQPQDMSLSYLGLCAPSCKALHHLRRLEIVKVLCSQTGRSLFAVDPFEVVSGAGHARHHDHGCCPWSRSDKHVQPPALRVGQRQGSKPGLQNCQHARFAGSDGCTSYPGVLSVGCWMPLLERNIISTVA